jgi:dTDP-4-amino-4,6-dideoxygalactose transaminase
VSSAITPRTKAIVAVDYAGHPADLDELRKIADSHGVYLIEDAAHSIGSTYKGRPVGSIADITTFSFFPTKNLTTGEGGAVASIHPELLERAKRFSRQGLVRDPMEFRIDGEGAWHQEVHEFGLNYRLPDILCGLGVSQLKRLEEFKIKKRDIFDYYSNELKDFPQIILPRENPDVEVNWHLFPTRFDPKDREKIFASLRKAGIGVQVNYMPAYWHPKFTEMGFKKGMFPVSDFFYSGEISLPIHSQLTKEELVYIVESIRTSL